ncbi:hypothetical protein D3C87_79470 [compost metagenome]
MKRLRKKISTLVHNDLRRRRTNRRLIFAEWVPADVNDPNVVQYITDVMASGGNVQIEYNGEWKTIAPYGWNSSQAGNVLLMCYKDTGEVRSYRLDRITNFQFDSDTMDTSMFAPEETQTDEEITVDGLEVPTLPNEQQDEFSTEQSNTGPESPFETAIETLEDVNDQTSEETPQEDTFVEEEHPNELTDANEINDNNTIPQENDPNELEPVTV